MLDAPNTESTAAETLESHPRKGHLVTVSTTVRRTLAAAAITPLLLTGVVACGGDSDDAEGSGTSAEKSSALQPGQDTLVLSDLSTGDEVDPADFVETVANGVEASTTARVTMKIGAGPAGEMTGEGELDYTSDPPEMAMKMAIPMLGNAAAEMRLVDGVLYLSMGQLSGGKFWKLDPEDPAGPLGDFGGMLDQMDPKSSLEKMESAIDKVTFTGEEQVDGQTLDHYELTVDPKRLTDDPGADLPAEVDNLTYDLWLDEEGRIAKMAMDPPAAGTQGSIEMTVTGWGEDVDIEAPPAGEITDMPDLGSMMGGMPSGSAAG